MGHTPEGVYRSYHLGPILDPKRLHNSRKGTTTLCNCATQSHDNALGMGSERISVQSRAAYLRS